MSKFNAVLDELGTIINGGPQQGEEKDTEVDFEESQESATNINVEADEELSQLINDQQVCDFASRLNYLEAYEQNEIFEGFLTNFFMNKKFVIGEAVLFGADVAYSLLTKQPTSKIVDLFLMENVLVAGAGVGGKIVSYIKTRRQVNKAIRYAAKSVLLREQIDEKVAELAEEQGAFAAQEQSEKAAQMKDLNPYIR